MQMQTYRNIDEYIVNFPPKVQEVLQKIRKIISEIVVGGEEAIKYGIPTFRLKGKNVVHFAGYKNHIGFYPGAAPVEQFKKDLTKYVVSKGTVQFQLTEPIPYDLIKKITTHCFHNSLGK